MLLTCLRGFAIHSAYMPGLGIISSLAHTLRHLVFCGSMPFSENGILIWEQADYNVDPWGCTLPDIFTVVLQTDGYFLLNI